jgi:hypothetical protein
MNLPEPEDVIQRFRGAAHYFPDHRSGPHRLIVAVACHLEDRPTTYHALLDTGSQWCVLPPSLAAELGLDPGSEGESLPLHTRFGLLQGRLESVAIHFLADRGERLRVEATCFISEDWPGPFVIGWKGCLERMRFALDPGDDSFCFGTI